MNNFSMKKNSVIFNLAYLLLMVSTFCSRVVLISDYLKYFKYLGIFLLSINCLIQSKVYKKKEILLILFLTIIGLASFYVSKDETILILFLIIFSTKKLNIESFIKYDLRLKICITLLLVLLSMVGLTNEFIVYRENMIRYSFGFAQPNIFGFVVSMIIIEAIYLYREKFKIKYIFLCIPFIFFIDQYANSRSSVILLILVLVTWLLQKNKYFKKCLYSCFTKQIIINSFYIFSLLTIFAVHLYNSGSELGNILNILFTGRIRYASLFMYKYDFTVFGNNLLLINTEMANINKISPMILDNTFIYIVLRYGLMIYFILAVFIKKLINKLYKRDDIILIVIFFMLIIYGLMEKYLVIIFYNVFLIYFRNLIYGDATNE